MILVDTPSAILDAVASVGYAAYAYAKICFKCGFNSKAVCTFRGMWGWRWCQGTRWRYLIYLNYERSKWLWVKYYASDFFCCCLLFLYPFTIFMLLFWIQHIAHCLLYHSFCCNFYSSKLNLRKPNNCQENINFPSPKQAVGFNA